MRNVRTFVAAMFTCLVLSAQASAALIDYSTTNLSGSSWRYDYTILNTPALAFDEFTIFFSLGSYSNLSVASSPSNWDVFLVQPDPFLPDDGFVDGLSLSGLVAPDTAVSGFSVTFDYLQTGAPSSQVYDLIDSSTFSIVGTGTTTLAVVNPPPPAPPPGTVSIPPSGLLLAIGLAMTGSIRYARRHAGRSA